MKSPWLPAPDRLLLWAVLLLTGLGLVMIYSASAITARQSTGDSLFFVKRQVAVALVGCTGAVRRAAWLTPQS